MNVYGAGSLVRIDWTTYDSNDAIVEPTATYLVIKNPNDVETTYAAGVDSEITQTATGTFYALINTDSLVGLWVYEVFTSGTGQAHTLEQEFRTE